jgi:sugar phosphate permease
LGPADRTVLLAVAALGLAAAPASASFPGRAGAIAYLQGDVGGVAPVGIATTQLGPIGPTCAGGEPRP